MADSPDAEAASSSSSSPGRVSPTDDSSSSVAGPSSSTTTIPASTPVTASLNGRTPPTDYGAVVLTLITQMTRATGTLDQSQLRNALSLAASHLLADTATDAERGGARWSTGLNRLVDMLVALHARGELELATVNEASKACAECWAVAGAWRGLEHCRDGVRAAAAKLKGLLDPNGRTYRGQRVYAP